MAFRGKWFYSVALACCAGNAILSSENGCQTTVYEGAAGIMNFSVQTSKPISLFYISLEIDPASKYLLECDVASSTSKPCTSGHFSFQGWQSETGTLLVGVKDAELGLQGTYVMSSFADGPLPRVACVLTVRVRDAGLETGATSAQAGEKSTHNTNTAAIVAPIVIFFLIGVGIVVILLVIPKTRLRLISLWRAACSRPQPPDPEDRTAEEKLVRPDPPPHVSRFAEDGQPPAAYAGSAPNTSSQNANGKDAGDLDPAGQGAPDRDQEQNEGAAAEGDRELGGGAAATEPGKVEAAGGQKADLGEDSPGPGQQEASATAPPALDSNARVTKKRPTRAEPKVAVENISRPDTEKRLLAPNERDGAFLFRTTMQAKTLAVAVRRSSTWVSYHQIFVKEDGSFEIEYDGKTRPFNSLAALKKYFTTLDGLFDLTRFNDTGRREQ